MKAENQETGIIWAAGFFDGEGCVMVRPDRRSNQMKRTAYNLTITVTNVKLEPIRRFQQLFGGSTYRRSPKPKTNRQECWRWVVHGSEAKRVLATRLPWLIVRNRQAETAISFPIVGHLIHGGKSNGLPTDVWVRQQRIYRRIKQLNKSGFRTMTDDSEYETPQPIRQMRLIKEAS